MSNSVNILLLDFIVRACGVIYMYVVKKAAFKVELYLYFKPTNVQTLCFLAHSKTIITRHLNIQPVQGAGMRTLKDHVTTVPLL